MAPAGRGHWDPAYWDPNECEPGSGALSPAIRFSLLTTLAAKLLVESLAYVFYGFYAFAIGSPRGMQTKQRGRTNALPAAPYTLAWAVI